MKIKVTIFLLAIVVLSLTVLEACKKAGTGEGGSDDNTPYNPTPISLTIPAGWPQPSTNIFADNPPTEQGFQLGKKLFYDGRLSKDGNFPCASCHQQFAAFATFDHDLSHGFDNSFTTRNAPGLFNLAWMTSFQWDGGINHIEVQPLAPITAQNEMAETIDNVISKLQQDATYRKMFKAAYGTDDITTQRMLRALAQFMGTIVSYNSKYDKVKRSEATFTVSEQKGYDFFKANCATCHTEPLFTDNSFRNNGLSVNAVLKDYGRMRVTGSSSDSLKFKVPSLRNVVYTFPYMHDGRLYTLGQVIDHYRSGIITTQPTLDPLLKNRIPITNTEKNDLINFLYTLNDTALVNNSRFAQF